MSSIALVSSISERRRSLGLFFLLFSLLHLFPPSFAFLHALSLNYWTTACPSPHFLVHESYLDGQTRVKINERRASNSSRLSTRHIVCSSKGAYRLRISCRLYGTIVRGRRSLSCARSVSFAIANGFDPIHLPFTSYARIPLLFTFSKSTANPQSLTREVRPLCLVLPVRAISSSPFCSCKWHHLAGDFHILCRASTTLSLAAYTSLTYVAGWSHYKQRVRLDDLSAFQTSI